MKKYIRYSPMVFLILFLSVMLFSCTEKSAAELIPSGYTEWETTTDIELDYQVPGHGHNYRKIYINANGTGAAVSEQSGKAMWDYPDGTIIVKEVYPSQEIHPDDTPKQLTVMVKDRDNEKARGGWLWLVKDMESGTTNIITHEFCITCHANANEGHPYGDRNTNEEFRDYVFFPYRSD
jgi:hypothetical protein